MKTMKLLTSIFVLLIAIIIFDSCKDSGTKEDANKEVTSQESGIEYDSKYICPMHCKGSGSNEEGKCPVCEMDYVLNKNYKEVTNDDDDEGHNHDGHDHEHDGHDHNH